MACKYRRTAETMSRLQGLSAPAQPPVDSIGSLDMPASGLSGHWLRVRDLYLHLRLPQRLGVSPVLALLASSSMHVVYRRDIEHIHIDAATQVIR